jgi:hypothetical protein
VGYRNALTRGGSVRLDHDRILAEPAEVGERGALPVEGFVAGGGDAGVVHQLLGEDLRALYLGCGPRGAEDLEISLPEGFGDAPDQGRLGADDGQVYLVLSRVVAKRDQVVGGDIRRLGDAGYAGVAWGGVHLGL